jgi:hypothetical protein
MVRKSAARPELVTRLRRWASALPEGSVSISETDTEFEHVVTIDPSNPRASTIEVRFAKDEDVFDVALGEWVQFDDVPSQPDLLDEILRAVAAGQLEEEVVMAGSTVVASKGRLSLARDQWYSNRRNIVHTIASLFRTARRTRIKYEPFSVVDRVEP